jgi:chemotaxis protein MotB
MRRTRRREEIEGGRGKPALWLITFSDFVTLLLTFFVLLVAMSSIDQKRLQSAFRYFETSGRQSSTSNRPPAPLSSGELALRSVRADLERLYPGHVQDFDKLLAEGALGRGADAGEFIWMRKDSSGDFFSVILGSRLLFKPGAAEMESTNLRAIEKLADFIKTSDYEMMVDVHTAPARRGDEGADATGEALSVARAHALLNYLLVECGVDPKRLAVGAYGGSQPLTESAQDPASGMNARVEFIFEKAALR